MRFSPACAGNICHCYLLCGNFTVQPRMCGEHPGGYVNRENLIGSAPRVRGTFGDYCHNRDYQRFSPACAGNMFDIGVEDCVTSVQPRMCGEHETDAGLEFTADGSAPHVRGTLARNQVGYRYQRFSPACAGNMDIDAITAMQSSVQPRMCGEH